MHFIRKRRNPTDIQILETIYNKYYDKFKDFDEKTKDRETKVYIPIDLKSVAEDLKVDGDIVFGRLYYYLDYKYRYTNESKSKVYFFAAFEIPNSRHCINFPYLASILADLRDKQKKYKTATTISVLSLGIAIVSLLVSILVKTI